MSETEILKDRIESLLEEVEEIVEDSYELDEFE